MTAATAEVSPDEAEIRLDRWFRRRFPGLTQGTIQKLCRTGQIRVDGKRADAATRLVPGQMVRVPPLPEGPAPAPPSPGLEPQVIREMAAMVLYRDDHVIALNKPHGLAVQGGPGIARHVDGMLDALRFGAADRPRLVHRLDMDTSGLLLLARTPGSAARLAESFRAREVRKVYWAVVSGRPSPEAGEIDLKLVKLGGPRGERIAVAEPRENGALRAITTYRTLDHAADRLAWLELSPLTGRTHQLRVHCASMETPIVGDVKYGGFQCKVDGLADKLHLHARALTLPHPGGGTLALEADIGSHMRETFRLMGFEALAPMTPRRRPGVPPLDPAKDKSLEPLT